MRVIFNKVQTDSFQNQQLQTYEKIPKTTFWAFSFDTIFALPPQPLKPRILVMQKEVDK